MYKIVAADARAPRNGRCIESLGEYHPVSQPAQIKINEERAMYWLNVGAQPTDTVKSLLSKKGLMLQLHLKRKGKDEATITEELAKWRDAQTLKNARQMTKKQTRAQKKKASEAAPAEAAPAEAAPAEAAPAAE